MQARFEAFIPFREEDDVRVYWTLEKLQNHQWKRIELILLFLKNVHRCLYEQTELGNDHEQKMSTLCDVMRKISSRKPVRGALPLPSQYLHFQIGLVPLGMLDVLRKAASEVPLLSPIQLLCSSGSTHLSTKSRDRDLSSIPSKAMIEGNLSKRPFRAAMANSESSILTTIDFIKDVRWRTRLIYLSIFSPWFMLTA